MVRFVAIKELPELGVLSAEGNDSNCDILVEQLIGAKYYEVAYVLLEVG